MTDTDIEARIRTVYAARDARGAGDLSIALRFRTQKPLTYRGVVDLVTRVVGKPRDEVAEVWEELMQAADADDSRSDR